MQPDCLYQARTLEKSIARVDIVHFNAGKTNSNY